MKKFNKPVSFNRQTSLKFGNVQKQSLNILNPTVKEETKTVETKQIQEEIIDIPIPNAENTIISYPVIYQQPEVIPDKEEVYLTKKKIDKNKFADAIKIIVLKQRNGW